jgi:hypothetical protein
MKGQAKKRSLHNVLKAYSVYDTDVGYTQGMNYIVSMHLLYMNDEEDFWVMVGLFKVIGKMRIRGLYFNGLLLVHKYLFQFEMHVKEQLPKLANNFEEEIIMLVMYGSSWFMIVFSTDFPFPLFGQISDIFLYEGMKIIFQVGMSLLELFQDDLLKLPFESLLPFL